jgi:hypothetical protein
VKKLPPIFSDSSWFDPVRYHFLCSRCSSFLLRGFFYYPEERGRMAYETPLITNQTSLYQSTVICVFSGVRTLNMKVLCVMTLNVLMFMLVLSEICHCTKSASGQKETSMVSQLTYCVSLTDKNRLKHVVLLVKCNNRHGSLQVTELCICGTNSDMNNSAKRHSALFTISDCDARRTVAHC